MKHSIMLMAALGLALTAVSCRQAPLDAPANGGRLSFNISVDADAPSTKAITAYTTLAAAEKKIKHVQLLIYDDNGILEQYFSNTDFTYEGGGTETTGKVTATSETLTVGNKTVYAILNSETTDFSGCTRIQDAQAITATGIDNFNDKSGTFVQVASATVVVKTDQTVSVNLKAQRRVARITLVGLQNNLGNQLPISNTYVFISNAGGNTVNLISGEASGNLVNPNGRNGSDIINGSTVLSEQAMSSAGYKTSIAYGNTIAGTGRLILYAHPTPAGADAPNLIVATSIGGQQYFYKVPMDSFVANTTYTVSLTLNHLGTNDPAKDNEFGQLDVTITADDWTVGSNLEQTI